MTRLPLALTLKIPLYSSAIQRCIPKLCFIYQLYILALYSSFVQQRHKPNNCFIYQLCIVALCSVIYAMQRYIRYIALYIKTLLYILALYKPKHCFIRQRYIPKHCFLCQLYINQNIALCISVLYQNIALYTSFIYHIKRSIVGMSSKYTRTLTLLNFFFSPEMTIGGRKQIINSKP